MTRAQDLDPRCFGRNGSHDFKVKREEDLVDPRDNKIKVGRVRMGECSRRCGTTAQQYLYFDRPGTPKNKWSGWTNIH